MHLLGTCVVLCVCVASGGLTSDSRLLVLVSEHLAANSRITMVLSCTQAACAYTCKYVNVFGGSNSHTLNFLPDSLTLSLRRAHSPSSPVTGTKTVRCSGMLFGLTYTQHVQKVPEHPKGRFDRLIPSLLPSP